MKKITTILLAITSVICIALSFSGCKKQFDNSLPMKTAIVGIDYSDKTNKKVRLLISNEEETFDISGFELYDKSDYKKVEGLVGGDRLEIYYTDASYENIDHILVQRAKVLELYSAFTPGAPLYTKDVYSKDISVVVNKFKNGVYWAIDRDGNFIDLAEIDDVTPLYGTYLEEEIEITVENPDKVKLHYLHALYLYNPQA